MNDTQLTFTRNILWAAAVYFAACGISAITYPTLWLFVSGLPTTLSNELTLAFGAIISAFAPTKHAGLILTLAVGNAIDFCVTLKAVVAQQLPIINGGAFLAITVLWAGLLGIAYINVKRA